MAKGFSQYFDSFTVNGDKFTVHKSVIDKAIKQVKNDPDPFEDGERVAGRLDILEDMLKAIGTGTVRPNCMNCGMCHEDAVDGGWTCSKYRYYGRKREDIAKMVTTECDSWCPDDEP